MSTQIEQETSAITQVFDLDAAFSKHTKNTRRSIREAISKYSMIRKKENPQEINDSIDMAVIFEVWSGDRFLGNCSLTVKTSISGNDASGIVVTIRSFGSALHEAVRSLSKTGNGNHSPYHPTVYRSIYDIVYNTAKNMFNNKKIKVVSEAERDDIQTAQALPDGIIRVDARIMTISHSINRQAQVVFDTQDGDVVAALQVIISNSGKEGLATKFNITKGSNIMINPEVLYKSARSSSGICDVPQDIIKTSIIAKSRDTYLSKCKTTLVEEYAPANGFIMAARKRFPGMTLKDIYNVICNNPALIESMKTKA